MQFQEGELLFDFQGCLSAEKLDRQRVSLPHGMSLVDFVVEESDRKLLIEVKDPSQRSVPQNQKGKFAEKLRSSQLIDQKLVPKCRNSYCFLHLMEQDTKPFLYIVVLGTRALPTVGLGELIEFRKRLLVRLGKESDLPWKRPYVRDCVVLTEDTWTRHFPLYPLGRVRTEPQD